MPVVIFLESTNVVLVKFVPTFECYNMFIDTIDQTLPLLNFRIICIVCYFTNLNFCKHIQVFKTCYSMQTKAHLFGPNKKYGILQKSKCMPIVKSEKVT